MGKPTAIVFDVFGTLVNIGTKKAPYRFLLNSLSAHGRPIQSSDSKTIMANDGYFEDIAHLLDMELSPEDLTQLNQMLKEEIQSIYLYEDTLSTLKHLKDSGFKVAACSNLATPYGQAVLPLLPELDAHAWSYEVGAIKPEAPIYQHVADQLNCSAEEMLFIGDTPLADVDGPVQFGMSARLIQRKSGQTLRNILNDIW